MKSNRKVNTQKSTVADANKATAKLPRSMKIAAIVMGGKQGNTRMWYQLLGEQQRVEEWCRREGKRVGCAESPKQPGKAKAAAASSN